MFSEEFNEARDGGSGHVRGVVFEEVPEEFDLVSEGEEGGHFAARGFGVGEGEAGFDPVEELEGFIGPEVGLVRIAVGRGAQDEGVGTELVVFEVEVALTQRSAVAEGVLAAYGARRLETVA